MVEATTLAEYLDRWLDHIKPNRSTTTIRGYGFKIKRINAQLGAVRLDKLTAAKLDGAHRPWLDEGLDPSSVHHHHRILSARLRQAVKWGLIATAPTARATPPPRRLHPKEIPTPDIVQHLISTEDETRSAGV